MVCDGEIGRNPDLIIQAQKLYIILYVDNPSNFVASKGWVRCFHFYHGITQ